MSGGLKNNVGPVEDIAFFLLKKGKTDAALVSKCKRVKKKRYSLNIPTARSSLLNFECYCIIVRATSARQDATGMDITSRCTLGDPNKLPEGVPQPARMPYVSDKHPRQTLEVINLLRKHRELCDVVLVVGAKKIYAHRVILSACSPYFRYQQTNLLFLLTSNRAKSIWDRRHWPTSYHQI